MKRRGLEIAELDHEELVETESEIREIDAGLSMQSG